MKINLTLLFFLINALTIVKSGFRSTYADGDELKINLRKIKSFLTHQPISPKNLEFFKTIKNPENFVQNIIPKTNFIMNINKNEYCKILNTKILSEEDEKRLIWMVKRNYYYDFWLNHLPSATGLLDKKAREIITRYHGGIPLGYTTRQNRNRKINKRGDTKYYLFNHFTFKISLHEVNLTNNTKGYQIVGFTTYPSSIKQTEDKLGCADYIGKHFNKIPRFKEPYLPQAIEVNSSITFTYDVIFYKSNLTFSRRLDNYTNIKKFEKIHWFGITISNSIFVIFTVLVIIIFQRSLKQDIDSYNIKVTEDEFIDESGWKQVCNDVFRKPIYPMLLSSMVGNGVHLLVAVFSSLILIMFFSYEPEQKDNILFIMFIMSNLLSICGGYKSGQLYKSFQGKNWRQNAFWTSLLYPSLIFCIFIITNFLFFLENTEHTNFLEVILLLVVWLTFATPLTLAGAFFGSKAKQEKLPCRINACPSFIPDKPWYFRMRYLIWVSGLIPFMAVFIEFNFFMASVWGEHYDYICSFFLISFAILIIVSTEVSIIVVYFCLCHGDYRWWWKSFCFGGSSALYIMIYSIYYFFNYSDITRFSSIVYYFGSMVIISSIIFLACGSLSLLITNKYLIKIYSMIKFD